MLALATFERDILLWIHTHLRFAALTPVMRVLSLLGDKGIFWIALTVILLLFRRTRRLGIYCAVSIVLTFLVVNCAVKPLVARTRPYDLFPEIQILAHAEHDYSFPSGHSANSFAAAWILFKMTRKAYGTSKVMFRRAGKPYGVAALVLAALIAFSRLYVGVHYPTDVFAGIAIAIALAELTLHQLPRIEKKIARKKRAKRKTARRKASPAR